MTSAETIRAAISGTLTTRERESERASETGDRRSAQSRERGRKQKSSTADGDESHIKRSAVLRGVGISDCRQLQVDLRRSCGNRKTGRCASPMFEAQKPIRVLMSHWI